MMLLALSAPAVAVSCSKDPGKEQTGDNTTDTGETPSGPQNPGEASIINIKAGEDLQAALDGAAAGTIVRVQGGVTFKGQFKMRDGVQLSGGWDAAFTKADPDDNKTVLDGNNAGRVEPDCRFRIRDQERGGREWCRCLYQEERRYREMLHP